MTPMADEIVVGDNGLYVWLRPVTGSLVEFWARRYGARAMEECISDHGHVDLVDAGYDCPFVLGARPYRKGAAVLAALSHDMGAYYEAQLMREFLSATTADDYSRARRALSQASYPDELLDSVRSPE